MGTISRKLKQYRLAADLTQEQLANELGVTRQALSNWEHGKTEPDLEMLKRICNILQVDVKELLYEETEIRGEETGKWEKEEEETKRGVGSGDIRVISDIGGGGSTVTMESPKKEKDRKQGSGTKRVILIIVVCCVLLGSIIVCCLPIIIYCIRGSQHIYSEQGGNELSEPDNPYEVDDFNKELTDTWTNAGNYTYKIGTSFEDITKEDDRGFEDTYRYKGDGSQKYSSNVVVRYEYYYPEQDDYMSEEAFLKYLKGAGYFFPYGYSWEENMDNRANMGEGEHCYSFICTDKEWEKNGAIRTTHIIRMEGKKELLLVMDTYYESDNITDWQEEVQQIIDSVKYMEED